jgi:hypothetical protein
MDSKGATGEFSRCQRRNQNRVDRPVVRFFLQMPWRRDPQLFQDWRPADCWSRSCSSPVRRTPAGRKKRTADDAIAEETEIWTSVPHRVKRFSTSCINFCGIASSDHDHLGEDDNASCALEYACKLKGIAGTGGIGMSRSESPLKKRRRRSIIAFELIRLDRSAAEPLHEQLYRQIRDELKSGAFSDTASRLPSSRALAVDLGISRLTVNLALSKLHAEG